MTACLKQVKSIKKETQFTVFGYVRQNENKMALFCNIPSMICYLCLSYYYHGEYFEKAGDDLQISNDKMTITKVSNKVNWLNTAYGKTWIDSNIDQIAEWKFKMNKLENYICICLVSKDNRLNEDCSIGDDAPNFGFCDYGRILIFGGKPTNGFYGSSFHQTDQVSMILDTHSNGGIYLHTI